MCVDEEIVITKIIARETDDLNMHGGSTNVEDVSPEIEVIEEFENFEEEVIELVRVWAIPS